MPKVGSFQVPFTMKTPNSGRHNAKTGKFIPTQFTNANSLPRQLRTLNKCADSDVCVMPKQSESPKL